MRPAPPEPDITRRDAEPSKGKMTETPSSEIVSTPRCARPFGKLRRIAKLAREMPGVALNTLAHPGASRRTSVGR